jgi:adenylyltransferase/sulfurtransferase
MMTEPRVDFSSQETVRYSRNTLLDQVGWDGQARWRASRVLVVGAGGIGSAALLYLAAAGVGCLGLVDGDAVELSNLQRQILYRSADLGKQKAAVAEEALTALNPHCRVETFDQRLNPTNVEEVLHGFEVVLDASDNFPPVSCYGVLLGYQILVSAAGRGWHEASRDAARSPVTASGPVQPRRGSPPSESKFWAVAGTMGCLQAVEL